MPPALWLLFAFFVSSVSGNGYKPLRDATWDPRDRLDGQPWPKPVRLDLGEGYNTTLGSNLIISLIKGQCDIFDEAAKRYKPRFIFANSTAEIEEILVTIDSLECPSVVPAEMNEAYSIGCDDQRIYVWGAQIWGVLRAFETLSQLIIGVDNYGRSVLPWMSINDEPRFPHRGILLDTSRHYLSPRILKSTIDLMSQNKFNVFHWHMTDSESFPYKSEAVPQLVEGAYAPNHIYTLDDIKDIVAYARLRGVRVLPEFDTPAHMGAWGIGLPYLLTKCYDAQGKEVGDRNLFDLSTDGAWEVLEAVLKVFPDSHFHLGGDEIYDWAQNCWLNNKDIQQFMKANNLSTYTDVRDWYFKHLLTVLNDPLIKNPKKFLLWDDASDGGIPGEDFFSREISQVTANGNQAILSSCWYLDRIERSKLDWQDFYKCDPQGFNGTDAQKTLVVGGEAALWGEFVDETNLIPRLFPRASAVAEKLWSPANATNGDPLNEYPRLHGWSCRMIQRGFPVEPVNGAGFCPQEYQANLPI